MSSKFVRYRKKRIPTKEQAVARSTKVKAEAFEGRFFERVGTPTSTVGDLWIAYEPIAKRDNDAWQTDVGRAKHLLRHLVVHRASSLTLKDIDAYRTRRLGESTPRGTQPSAATLDRGVELLKRILNYGVACGKLPNNPVANAKLLRKPNVRRVVLDEVAFQRLLEASEDSLKPILLVAFDTGVRQREILDLRWEQVDLHQGAIRLAPQDTKGEESRLVVLTKRLRAVLEALLGDYRRLPSSAIRGPEKPGRTSRRPSEERARQRVTGLPLIGPPRRTTTDDDGGYEILNLAPGLISSRGELPRHQARAQASLGRSQRGHSPQYPLVGGAVGG